MPANATRSREQLLAELELLRKTVPPEQYGYASARILKQLQKLQNQRRRYAIT